ncbi:MAG: hypothetical protein EXQ58_02410 [Acidobacteria bacterium]|nr:hypothetical protein [Acidobacteriota bacterium]
MNCFEFETRLLDLVAEWSDEDFLRAEALSHVIDCSRCAARLGEERALAGGLRAWASAAQNENAPAHVEEMLLARFREFERAKAAGPTPLPNILPSKPAWWRTPGYMGLAASVLLLLGWALIQFMREAGVDEAQVLPLPKPTTRSEEKGAAPLKMAPAPPSGPVRNPARPVRIRTRQVSRAIPEARVQYAARPSKRSEGRLNEAESAANDRVEREVVPFMTAGPQFPSEQRQFVRVKLPRSALQVFGLPMNMECASGQAACLMDDSIKKGKKQMINRKLSISAGVCFLVSAGVAPAEESTKPKDPIRVE